MAINVEKLFENSDLFCRMQRFFKAGKSFGIDCISKFGKLFLVKNFSERTKILWIENGKAPEYFLFIVGLLSNSEEIVIED